MAARCFATGCFAAGFAGFFGASFFFGSFFRVDFGIGPSLRHPRYTCLVRLLLVVMLAACSGPQTLGPEGSTARLRGRVSDEPMEHMMTNVPGKQPAYFDYAPGKQVVVYWATDPKCKGEIVITGTVIAATGESKRRPSKGEPQEMFTERSIDVATASCVDV